MTPNIVMLSLIKGLLRAVELSKLRIVTTLHDSIPLYTDRLLELARYATPSELLLFDTSALSASPTGVVVDVLRAIVKYPAYPVLSLDTDRFSGGQSTLL